MIFKATHRYLDFPDLLSAGSSSFSGPSWFLLNSFSSLLSAPGASSSVVSLVVNKTDFGIRPSRKKIPVHNEWGRTVLRPQEKQEEGSNWEKLGSFLLVATTLSWPSHVCCLIVCTVTLFLCGKPVLMLTSGLSEKQGSESPGSGAFCASWSQLYWENIFASATNSMVTFRSHERSTRYSICLFFYLRFPSPVLPVRS